MLDALPSATQHPGKWRCYELRNQNGAETKETFRLICWRQTRQEGTKEKDVASLPEKGKQPKESVRNQPLSQLLADLEFVTSALSKIPEPELSEEKPRK